MEPNFPALVRDRSIAFLRTAMAQFFAVALHDPRVQAAESPHETFAVVFPEYIAAAQAEIAAIMVNPSALDAYLLGGEEAEDTNED